MSANFDLCLEDVLTFLINCIPLASIKPD